MTSLTSQQSIDLKEQVYNTNIYLCMDGFVTLNYFSQSWVTETMMIDETNGKVEILYENQI